jgi:hypothetical protein
MEQPLADHVFHPGPLNGNCARRACPLRRDQHPAVVSVVALPPAPHDPSCPVNHAGITRTLLIGDKGWEWRRCPVCNTLLEGAFTKPRPTTDKPFINRRIWSRWITLIAAWKGGYYKS